MSHVVAGSVIIVSKASLWHLLPSCEANLEVASFQLDHFEVLEMDLILIFCSY